MATVEEKTLEYLSELESDFVCQILSDWQRDKGTDKRQSWRVIPSSLLIAEYRYSVKHGFNRDKFIAKFEEIITENIIKLEINTVLFGHSQLNAFYAYEYALPEDMTEDEFELLLEDFEWYASDNDGNWRISDYALEKLNPLLWSLIESGSYEEKFYYIDRILNVAHQRSDLTRWFVEDGITLDMIASE